MRRQAYHRAPPQAAAPTPATSIQPPPGLAPVAPSAPDVAEMEKRLLAEIPVTDDELRELAQMRAKAVQGALLESGQISAQRVFILAPQSVNAAAQGQMRANFSLE
jgi:hypothetical protein